MDESADKVSIQFNPFGWTEPIPMWKLGEDHWVYLLISPITNLENFVYRYCRNDQCGNEQQISRVDPHPIVIQSLFLSETRE